MARKPNERKVPEHEIEMWMRELTDAGWRRNSWTVWMSPRGTLYRGPYYAWQVMRKLAEREIGPRHPRRKGAKV